MKLQKHTVTPLKAKLTVPFLQPVINRPRFNSILDDIKQKKITTIIAGAGYGKTTLAVQAHKYLKVNAVWYRLDETDCDFIIFIQHFIHGIRKYYKDFGNAILSLMNTNEIKKENRQAVLIILLNEIETMIDDDLLIFLDDFHTINDKKEIQDTLEFLIKHMTEKLHLIIISRSMPYFAVTHYAARREILQINESDIAFTRKEVESLYNEIFRIKLDKNIIQALYNKTNGWITGLVLFHYTLKENSNIILKNQAGLFNDSRKVIFNYLEENVFNKLSDKTIQFLIRTSILSTLEIDFCNQFLNIKDSEKILKDLVKKRLFTIPATRKADSWFYHNLFREFLIEKLESIYDKKEIADFHMLAASAREKNKELKEAVYHYIKAKNYIKAIMLLHTTGLDLINSGRINLFLSYYHDIPETITHNDAWISFQYGLALTLSGKSLESINTYKRAKKLYHADKMIKEEGICLNITANIYTFILGDFISAKKILNKVITQYKNEPEIYVEALIHLIFISACSGKYSEADKYFSMALLRINSIKDKTLHARIHIIYGYRYVYSGDMIKARDCGETGIQIIQQKKWDPLLLTAYNLIGMANYYSGEFTSGLEISLKGIRECEQLSLPDFASGWSLLTACLCSAEIDKIPEAISYGERALVTSEDQEGLWSRAWAFNALGYAYLRSGDLLKAEEMMRSAIHTIQKVELPYEEAYVKVGLAEVLIKKRQINKACQLLKEIELKIVNQKWTLTRVFILLSRCCWIQKRKKSAKSYLRSALLLSFENGYDRWIIKETDQLISVLLELYFDDELNEYIKNIFRRYDKNLSVLLKQIQKNADQKIKKTIALILNESKEVPAPGLKINCFGNFRLFIGREAILPEKWKNEKSKLLFKYLILNLSREYISKDVLLELLWPGQDPALTNNRFHVCLNAIRKILEPELPRGAHSSYLLRKGEAYKISPGQNSFIDITVFDEEMALLESQTSIEQKLEYCLKAEKIYKGDLFEEDRYTLWCMDAANEYREKYLKVLRYLITHFKNKDPFECIKYTKKYLRRDEYAEDMYQLQMKLYKQTGNRSMALRTYEQCKRKLETELESSLEKETEEIYQQIIAS